MTLHDSGGMGTLIVRLGRRDRRLRLADRYHSSVLDTLVVVVAIVQRGRSSVRQMLNGQDVHARSWSPGGRRRGARDYGRKQAALDHLTR